MELTNCRISPSKITIYPNAYFDHEVNSRGVSLGRRPNLDGENGPTTAPDSWMKEMPRLLGSDFAGAESLFITPRYVDGLLDSIFE